MTAGSKHLLTVPVVHSFHLNYKTGWEGRSIILCGMLAAIYSLSLHVNLLYEVDGVVFLLAISKQNASQSRQDSLTASW